MTREALICDLITGALKLAKEEIFANQPLGIQAVQSLSEAEKIEMESQ